MNEEKKNLYNFFVEYLQLCQKYGIIIDYWSSEEGGFQLQFRDDISGIWEWMVEETIKDLTNGFGFNWKDILRRSKV